MAAVVRLIDQHFGPHIYTLWHLFTEEKRKILFKILEGNLRGLEADFRQIFETNYAIMQAMREMQIPLPEALSTPAEFVLNADLRRLMEAPDVDVEAPAEARGGVRGLGLQARRRGPRLHRRPEGRRPDGGLGGEARGRRPGWRRSRPS